MAAIPSGSSGVGSLAEREAWAARLPARYGKEAIGQWLRSCGRGRKAQAFEGIETAAYEACRASLPDKRDAAEPGPALRHHKDPAPPLAPGLTGVGLTMTKGVPVHPGLFAEPGFKPNRHVGPAPARPRLMLQNRAAPVVPQARNARCNTKLFSSPQGGGGRRIRCRDPASNAAWLAAVVSGCPSPSPGKTRSVKNG